MDSKPSIAVFFIVLSGTLIEYVIKLAYIQWAYICALRFQALLQVSYDINDLQRFKFHELSFKKAE